MFVTVIHRIHDPKGFQEAEAKALEGGLPAGVALPVHAATRDHRSASASGKASRWPRCARSSRARSDRGPTTSMPR